MDTLTKYRENKATMQELAKLHDDNPLDISYPGTISKPKAMLTTPPRSQDSVGSNPDSSHGSPCPSDTISLGHTQSNFEAAPKLGTTNNFQVAQNSIDQVITELEKTEHQKAQDSVTRPKREIQKAENHNDTTPTLHSLATLQKLGFTPSTAFTILTKYYLSIALSRPSSRIFFTTIVNESRKIISLTFTKMSLKDALIELGINQELQEIFKQHIDGLREEDVPRNSVLWWLEMVMEERWAALVEEFGRSGGQIEGEEFDDGSENSRNEDGEEELKARDWDRSMDGSPSRESDPDSVSASNHEGCGGFLIPILNEEDVVDEDENSMSVDMDLDSDLDTESD